MMSSRKSIKSITFVFFGSLLISISQGLTAYSDDKTNSKSFSVRFTAESHLRLLISQPPTEDNAGALFVLPPCSGEIINDCVQAFEALDKDGKWVKGVFKEYLPVKDLVWLDEKFKDNYGGLNDIAFLKPDISRNIPAGGRTGIWELQSTRHSLGNSYALNVSFSGTSSNRSKPTDPQSIINWDYQIYSEITPISFSNGVYGCGGSFGNGNATLSCRDRYQEGEFPEFSKYRISVNFLTTKSTLKKSPWFTARLSNSKVSITEIRDGSQLLTLEGSPIRMSSVEAQFEKNEDNYKTLSTAIETYSEVLYGNKNAVKLSYENFLKYDSWSFGSGEPGDIDAWKELERKFIFSYTSEETMWSIRTALVTPNDAGQLANCNKDNLRPGLISTNAIAANPRPPIWDSELQELIYTVASPHTRKDGSLNVGVYELSIDERLATCLWGIDALSYRASIKVLSLDGSSKITTATYIKRDGYLIFRAAGFGYSTSIIKVQLGKSGTALSPQANLPDYFPDSINVKTTNLTDPVTTDASTAAELKAKEEAVARAAADKAAAETRAAAMKKTTITCIKGKVTKKVSAIKPKCPAGYKKK
jgi:hypothetical protein